MTDIPTWCEYWKLVDRSHDTETFEHQIPHGTLVRVRAFSSRTESIVFVPAAPVEGGPFR